MIGGPLCSNADMRGKRKCMKAKGNTKRTERAVRSYNRNVDTKQPLRTESKTGVDATREKSATRILQVMILLNVEVEGRRHPHHCSIASSKQATSGATVAMLAEKACIVDRNERIESVYMYPIVRGK
ncbi:uncharacterized protein RSE6_13239 [Rhynchosporium secalis]|uniref:Uncharacterized protein n=1 Tax=Rhynchosporium secalis TaxID=38038 RepID=A0A1E1MSD4_RHYSE|nr:uncharacterized protein RSE6_13239 [Rhynchosporium secalis]